MRWRCAPARRSSTWSSCSSSRSGISAPRLIGMDPIMWDPFRYKLGGRLLNSEGEEFTARYGVSEDGTLRHHPRRRHLRHRQGGGGRTRLAARRRISELPALLGDRAARGVRPGDRPARQEQHRSHQDAGRGGADRALSHGRRRGRRAHGRREVPGLLVAGEAVGGANGANRLSGNAITEALVFGRRAGRSAAERASRHRCAGIPAGGPRATRSV